jgi:cell division protein FtsI/penicillin-binding protein 2
MKIRVRIFLITFIFAYMLLAGRLFYWQIIKGKELSSEARGQYQTDYEIIASRGEIMAEGYSWLTASVRAWRVYADIPNLRDDTDIMAEKLAPLFIEDKNDRKALLVEIDRLKRLLNKDDVVWVPLKERVNSDIKNEIENFEFNGIGFEEQQMRTYPEGSVSAQLLGFVGKDDSGEDVGYFGLEGYYNLVLTGKPGFLSRESDASGLPIMLGNSTEIDAVQGVNLLTHIDKSIQIAAEEKLAKGIKKYDASAGTVIVMDPENGAVKAMVSFPSFDPREYYEYSNELFLNPAISSTFEPGSVFKVLVMASALDAGVVEPETECDICTGPVRIGKYSIETWNNQYFPNSTMTDVIIHSDNVGMVFTAQQLGADKLYDYLDKFGIGRLTDIDLQGEVTPSLRDKKNWSEIDLATISFGQGVAVTPVQMIRAVCAIANDGYLVKPQVVDKLVKDGWSRDIKPEIGERVISEKTAKEITAMMVEAAKNGESKWTYRRGFGVAGKTGTAQIPIAGHYDEEKTIASFVGFAPYNDPKFVMLVTLKEPTSSPWASETAAPLWYDIAEDMFYHYGIQPTKEP